MRNNPWEELYIERGWGDWMTPRQGLTVGMDLLDWMRFIVCAVHEINKDPKPRRRLRKAQRLYAKAMKVAPPYWMVAKTPNLMLKLIEDTQAEVDQLYADLRATLALAMGGQS